MTDKEAMKLALEALETLMLERGSIYEQAITALKARLAQPEQEALAWMDVDGNVSDNNDHKCFPIPLYTHPPQRTEPLIGCVNHDCAKCKERTEQEPDYWLGYGLQAHTEKPFENATALYKDPPQRTWIGMTKKEILLVNEKQDESIIAAPDNELIQFSRAIEAKLKQKNGYAEEKNT